jgi:hypothetical protein
MEAEPAESRYGGGVDVARAADLYAQGWSLRQIGAELGSGPTCADRFEARLMQRRAT